MPIGAQVRRVRLMKKKIMTVMAICAVSLAATACGSNTQETTAAETTTTETTTEMAADESTDAEEASAEGEETSGAEGEESEAAETTKADLSNVDPQEALGPGAFDENESVALEENQNFSDLENSDYKGFAGQVVQAVTAKDMNALADLMHYPVYISFVKDNDGVVSDKDSFLALDPEMVFDSALVEAVQAADLEALEPSMAGVVIGDDTPNVIINSTDGTLGIVGMNY